MMKKQILKTGFYLCMALVCFLCTSCSDSESDDSNNEEKKPVTTTVTYSFNVSSDYFSLTNLVVNYWNEEGKQISESLTSTTWGKTITLTRSQQFGYTITATAKPNIDELLIKDSYQMGYGYKDSYFSTNGVGTGSSTEFTLSIGKSKIKEYIEKRTEIHTFHRTWNMENDTFE